MSRNSCRGNHWERFRRFCIKRANWKCARCGKGGRLECHHKIPLSRGGAKWDLRNIEVVCRACHFDEHRAHLPERQQWLDLIADL